MPFGLPDLSDVGSAASSTFRRSVKAIKKPVNRAKAQVGSDLEDIGHGIKAQAQQTDRQIFGGKGLRHNISDVRALLKKSGAAVKKGQ